MAWQPSASAPPALGADTRAHGWVTSLTTQEGRLNFRPTYRMLKGQDGYSNKKNQNASWCDRVLWRSHPAYRNRVSQTQYTAVPDINQSDHRPVYATFVVKTMLPYLNTSATVSNYGQCHIAVP